MASTLAMDTKELVKYRVEGGIAIFELDDPPANTYSYEMMQQFDAAILKARMDESVHILLFTALPFFLHSHIAPHLITLYVAHAETGEFIFQRLRAAFPCHH